MTDSMDLKEIDRQEKIQAEILHSFHQALKNEEFQIYFQPKVSPASGKISSAEVLVRWLRDGKMRWSPAVYIPLFEQNGFVINLDYYVYEKTFRWLQEFSRQLPADFRISLNVSPLHFEELETFVKKICELIRTYKDRPEIPWRFPYGKCKDCSSGSLPYAEAHGKIHCMRRCGN